ncbi:hypothetical protein J4I86_001870, partial [Neisseria gonorrhoeae]
LPFSDAAPARCRLKPSDGIFNAPEPRFRQCPMLGAAFAVLPRRRARYNPPRHPPDLETCLCDPPISFPTCI